MHALHTTNVGGFNLTLPEEQVQLYFDTAFYFIMITVMTVGYGDILPGEVFSRVLIGIFILFMIIFISK